MEDNKKAPEKDEVEEQASLLPEQIEVTKMPDLSGVPERAQQMLVLRSAGFSYASIGNLFKVSHVAVRKSCLRWDPEGSFNLSKEDRQSLIAQLIRARLGEVLLLMTPEKLNSANVATLGKMATGLSAAYQRMAPKESASSPQESDLNRWLERLRGFRELPEDESSSQVPDPQ